MSTPTAPPFTDPKSAKAQAKAEKAYRKASRPFYKKKRFILLALIAVVVIIAIATSGGGGSDDSSSSSSSDSGSSSDSAKAAGLNEAVRDGKFEFNVKGVDCSQTTLGSNGIETTANGVFCVVSLDVANIGDEAQTLDATSQYGYDAQNRKYSTDTEAEFYLPDTGGALFNQLNPGTSVTGQIVFDVPAGTQLTKLELHDSMFSGGVDVTLG